jgi:hypothetical protein
MKIKKIEYTPITQEDVIEYRNLIQNLQGNFFTANDVNMDKRISTIFKN